MPKKESDNEGEPRFVYLVGRINGGLRKRLGEALRDSELSVPEFTAMSVLRRRPGLSNAQLARRSLISPQSMIDVISRLENRGFIVRQADPAHARILETRLTRSGQAVLKRADKAVAGLEDDLMADVPAKHRQPLRRWLIAVMQRMQDDRD